jgi:hypothetical protein
MKHIFSIFIIFGLSFTHLCGQVTIDCQSEIRIKNQKISDLEKSNSSLTRQNGELQTRVILLNTGGNNNASPPPSTTANCPPSFEKENEQFKKDVEELKQQIAALKKVNDTKEVLLNEVAEKNEKQVESIKTLTKTNSDKDEELKKREQALASLSKDLEETKSKLANSEKALQDTTKSLIAIKLNSQVLYDSLYFSIDFKKDFIRLDIKETDAKDAKLGDVLIEIPNAMIVGTNWTANNIEKKMKRIAALYVKYRDKLKIQLIAAPIETDSEKDKTNNILIKVIRKLNVYASVVMPSDNQVPITEKDFEIVLNNQGKDGVLRIALVKK